MTKKLSNECQQLHLAPLIRTIHLVLCLKPLCSTYMPPYRYMTTAPWSRRTSLPPREILLMSVKDQKRVRDRQTQAQGLVEWDHHASWDINSWYPSVTQFSYHHLFSLNSKTLSCDVVCKNRASSCKKLSANEVQLHRETLYMPAELPPDSQFVENTFICGTWCCLLCRFVCLF